VGPPAVRGRAARFHGRRLAIVAVFALAAVGLGLFANSQDDVRRRWAAEQKALSESRAPAATATWRGTLG